MRIVVQRVLRASISVDSREIASIGKGIVALIGFHANETDQLIADMVRKIIQLRLFDDMDGRMNLSLKEARAELLLVPQVTLTVSLNKGTRPSFHTAAPAEHAKNLFSEFIAECKRQYSNVVAGSFQEYMLVSIENDGPVTFVLDDKLSR